MLESCIHLTLYPKYVELVHWLSRVILPFGELKTKDLFLWSKGGMYSRAIDNAMGIICKDSEGENIPDIRGKTNPFPLFLNGGRKKSVSE